MGVNFRATGDRGAHVQALRRPHTGCTADGDDNSGSPLTRVSSKLQPTSRTEPHTHTHTHATCRSCFPLRAGRSELWPCGPHVSFSDTYTETNTLAHLDVVVVVVGANPAVHPTPEAQLTPKKNNPRCSCQVISSAAVFCVY